MSIASLSILNFRNAKNSPFLFPLFLLIFLSVHLPLLCAISFNYSDFSNSQNLELIDDAFVFDGILSLTRNQANTNLSGSIGRAVYSEEFQLWDAVTGKVADFITHFSFNISMLQPPSGGDGIAFFLAPNGSKSPEYAGGGCLALISNCSGNTTAKEIVAVEFDTFKNLFDPDDNHIGIDVNSMKSARTLSLNRSLKNGSRANARISYDSQSRNLSVFLTLLDGSTFNGNYSFSYQIDLSQVLPERINVGFSSSTGAAVESHLILSWKFQSTEISSKPGGGGLDTKWIVIIAVASAACLACLLLIAYFCRNKIKRICRRGWWGKTEKRGKKNNSMEKREKKNNSIDDEIKQGMPKEYSYQELVQATNNFAEKLGEGGSGEVYKGMLSDSNTEIAVKRFFAENSRTRGRLQYITEVKTNQTLRHKNLVKFLGWCHEEVKFLIVFEFMSEGSLHDHLHDNNINNKKVLSFEERYKIVLDLGTALQVVHERCEPYVLHRDIKSRNVMLDSEFKAKLGVFGLAKLVEENLDHKISRVAGTTGYIAPEYFRSRRISKESDIYSFGILLLEIASGRSPERRNEDSYMPFADFIWDLYKKGNLPDVADYRLKMEYDTKQMECLLAVGLWCAQSNHKERPTVGEALKVLKFEAALPNISQIMAAINPDVPSSSTN